MKLRINETPIEMGLDTGVALSIISNKTLISKLEENYQFCSFNGKLKTDSGELIQPLI